MIFVGRKALAGRPTVGCTLYGLTPAADGPPYLEVGREAFGFAGGRKKLFPSHAERTYRL